MVDQEARENHPKIRMFGCYLLSIVKAASAINPNSPATSAGLNSFYTKLLNNGVTDIAPDCTVENPEQVFLELGVKVKQIKNADGSIAIPPTTEVPGAIEILCYHWPEKDFIHFVLGDGHGRVAYDPIHRGSNTVKNGFLHSKRLFIPA